MMASALETAVSYNPSFLHPVCVTFVAPFNHHTNISLTRPCFAGPWVSSVGGTRCQHPEVATPRSGGGFSNFFERPLYQKDAVPAFLDAADYPYLDSSHYYRYAPYHDLTFSYFAICGAPLVVATPISPRKRSVAVSTATVMPMSRGAQLALLRCVFPYSLLLPISIVHSYAPN